MERGASDSSVEGSALARTFIDAADQAYKQKADFDPSRLENLQYSTEPSDDAHHLEVYWSGKKIDNLHPSQGTVVTSRQGYDDNAIKAIYKRIIGRTK